MWTIDFHIDYFLGTAYWFEKKKVGYDLIVPLIMPYVTIGLHKNKNLV